ncbi:MAG: hypothetical protein QM727_10750 [Niabella sp.]
MKKSVIATVVAVILFACQKNTNDLERNEPFSSSSLKEPIQAKIPDSTIIPLDETKFPKKNKKVSLMSYSSSELNQLEGLEFYIQSKDSYYGKNSFKTKGLGKEITLEPFSSGNKAELFYLKILPATSGIPYLIYSYDQKAPIGVGTYPSNPNKYLLYTANSTNPSSLFGFSWDFYKNDAQNNYYIENQDLVGQGSGGWWDIYNYVISINDGTIGFAKNNYLISQQFSIVPNDEFTIEELEFTEIGAQILQTSPSFPLKAETIKNNGANPLIRKLDISVTQSDASSFKETSAISTKYTASSKVGASLFKVVEASGTFTFERGTQETIEYGKSSNRTTTITDSYSLTVSPYSVLTWKYTASRHNIRLPYTVHLKGVKTGKLLTINGLWEGYDYTFTTLEITESPINSPSVVINRYVLKANK